MERKELGRSSNRSNVTRLVLASAMVLSTSVLTPTVAAITDGRRPTVAVQSLKVGGEGRKTVAWTTSRTRRSRTGRAVEIGTDGHQSSSYSHVPASAKTSRPIQYQHQHQHQHQHQRRDEAVTVFEKHSLYTMFDGNNGGNGMMFDVINRKKRGFAFATQGGNRRQQEAKNTLTFTSKNASSASTSESAIVSITSLHIHVNLPSPENRDTTTPVQVFTRLGSHRGYESDAPAWALIFNSTVESAGFEKATWLPNQAFGNCEGCVTRASLWAASSVEVIGDSASGHLEIPPGQSRAFYVNLPDGKWLRYSNPSTRVNTKEEAGNTVSLGEVTPQGDAISVQDDNVQIAEGTGLGGLFGRDAASGGIPELYTPRAWNGVLHYVAGFYDPEADANPFQEAVAEKLSDNEDLDNLCPRKVETTFQDNTGSFGNMFDIRINSKPHLGKALVRIRGLEIHIDIETLCTYQIYYRIGSFTDAQEPTSVDTKWIMIAEGTVLGAGKGVPTLIPPKDWIRPISIPLDDAAATVIVGFYVTLSSADLRYKKEEKEEEGKFMVGDIFTTSQDGLVSITAGVGVATYPLGTVLYGPRIWNGLILYEVDSDADDPPPCPTMPPTAAPTTLYILTNIVFEFLVYRPLEMTEWDLNGLLDDSISQTIEGLLTKDFLAIAEQFELEIVNVASATSLEANLNEDDCMISDPSFACTAVNSHVTLKHSRELPSDSVIANILKATDLIADSVGLHLNYIGDEAANAEVGITLTGIERKMNDVEVKHFEESTKEFLNQSFESGEGGYTAEDGEPIRVLEVSVEEQTLIQGASNRGRRFLQLSSSSISAVEVRTSVTAECRKCRDKFSADKVDDAFDSRPEEFKKELKKPRVIRDEDTGKEVKSAPLAYFERVDDVEAVALESSPTAASQSIGLSTGTVLIITSCTLAAVVIASVLLVLLKKKRQSKPSNNLAANVPYGDLDFDQNLDGLALNGDNLDVIGKDSYSYLNKAAARPHYKTTCSDRSMKGQAKILENDMGRQKAEAILHCNSSTPTRIDHELRDSFARKDSEETGLTASSDVSDTSNSAPWSRNNVLPSTSQVSRPPKGAPAARSVGSSFGRGSIMDDEKPAKCESTFSSSRIPRRYSSERLLAHHKEQVPLPTRPSQSSRDVRYSRGLGLSGQGESVDQYNSYR